MQDNWQPIETAPHAEDILVGNSAGEVAVAVFAMVPDTTEPDWLYAHWPWEDTLQFIPTHWMPLPEPPQ